MYVHGTTYQISSGNNSIDTAIAVLFKFSKAYVWKTIRYKLESIHGFKYYLVEKQALGIPVIFHICIRSCI
jgi:hypothetical protein